MKQRLIGRMIFATALGASVALATAAFAEEPVARDCKTQLGILHQDLTAENIPAHFKEEWKPYSFSAHLGWGNPSGKQVVVGKGGHKHTMAELRVMNDHMKKAMRACEKGEEGDAALHINAVRAIFRLRELDSSQHGELTPPSK
jgi:hypothetical protein